MALEPVEFCLKYACLNLNHQLMKTYTLTLLVCFLLAGASTSAQKSAGYEKHGKTLNLGLGVG